MTTKIVKIEVPKLTLFGTKTFEELLFYNDKLRRELEDRLLKQFADIEFEISVSETVLNIGFQWKGPIRTKESRSIRTMVRLLVEGVLSPRSEWMWK